MTGDGGWSTESVSPAVVLQSSTSGDVMEGLLSSSASLFSLKGLPDKLSLAALFLGDKRLSGDLVLVMLEQSSGTWW